MLNYDVILYIEQFLKSCDICKRKDIKIANRICVVCKKYVCAKCKMIRDYTEFETRMLYCNDCHGKQEKLIHL